MAKRASETFVAAVKPKGKRIFEKNEIVPAEFAKGRDNLVYDDGAKRVESDPVPYVRGPRDTRKAPAKVEDTEE
jgi:hypothetical protein